MKLITVIMTVLLLGVFAGCGGKDTGLIGRLPAGYDAYITIDPDGADLPGILSVLGDDLPEHQLRDIAETDLGFDVFQWDEWTDELGIEPGEIGIVGKGEDMDFLAFFFPCGDGEKLRDFVREAGGEDEAEFLRMDEYTVVVIEWENSRQLADFEDVLSGTTLAGDEAFAPLIEQAGLDSPALAFAFSGDITEVPVMGFVASGENTRLRLSALIDDEEFLGYAGAFGEGLQSRSIMLPENTMAAVRTTMDMEWLAEEYGNMGSEAAEMEAALPFIGFSTMEEFIAVFTGDFCLALTEMELDEFGEPEGGAGIMAISLADPDKLQSTLDMISAFTDGRRENMGDYTAYMIESGSDVIWYFITDGVLYVSFSVSPEEVTGGVRATDFFSGTASDGFMGGAANPEMIVEGLSLDSETEEAILSLFDESTSFSVSFDGRTAFSEFTAGPGALEALVSLALRMQ